MLTAIYQMALCLTPEDLNLYEHWYKSLKYHRTSIIRMQWCMW